MIKKIFGSKASPPKKEDSGKKENVAEPNAHTTPINGSVQGKQGNKRPPSIQTAPASKNRPTIDLSEHVLSSPGTYMMYGAVAPSAIQQPQKGFVGSQNQQSRAGASPGFSNTQVHPQLQYQQPLPNTLQRGPSFSNSLQYYPNQYQQQYQQPGFAVPAPYQQLQQPQQQQPQGRNLQRGPSFSLQRGPSFSLQRGPSFSGQAQLQQQAQSQQQANPLQRGPSFSLQRGQSFSKLLRAPSFSASQPADPHAYIQQYFGTLSPNSIAYARAMLMSPKTPKQGLGFLTSPRLPFGPSAFQFPSSSTVPSY